MHTGAGHMKTSETVELATRDGIAFGARRLVAGDAPALERFYAELSPRSRAAFLAHGLDDDTLRKALCRSQAGDDLVLGLFEGERMVGYFFLWYFRTRVPLLGVGLLDENHGRGLGRAMLELLIGQATANGCNGIELTTQMDNARAFSLYQTVGFRYHRDVETVQGDGTVEVERAMFYAIQPGAQPADTPHAPPV